MDIHRICYHEKQGHVEFVIPKGHKPNDVYSHVPRFTGIYSFTWNIISEFLFKEGAFNWTLVTTNPSSRVDPTKCLKFMTQNKTDLPIGFSDIYQDRVDDVDIITDGTQDNMFFVSSYVIDNRTSTQDIFLSSLSSFSLGIWFCIFVTSFLLMLVLHLVNNLQLQQEEEEVPISRGFRNLQWNFWDQMTCRNFIETDNTLGKFVCLLTLILSFFVICYWSNLLHTDLVVTPQPDTVNSFKDIIDKRLWVIWGREGSFLPEGILGTYNGKTFYEAVEHRKHVRIDSRIEEIMYLVEKVLSSSEDKAVALLHRSFLGMLLSFTCQQWKIKDGLSDDKRLMYPWVFEVKENAPTIRSQFVKRKGFQMHPIISHRMKRYFEMGWPQKLVDIMTKKGSNIWGHGKDGDSSDEIMRCLRHSRELPKEDPRFTPLRIQNFRYSLMLLGSLMFLACLVLVVEVCIANKGTTSEIEADDVAFIEMIDQEAFEANI